MPLQQTSSLASSGGIKRRRVERTGEPRRRTVVASSDGPSQQNVERPQSSRTHDLERIAQHFLGDIALDDGSIRQTADKIASLSQDSASGSEQRLNNGGGNGAEESFDTQFVSKVTAHYSGEFSHWNFSQKLWRWVSHRLDSLGVNNLSQRIQVKDFWRPTQLQSPANVIHQTMAHLPPFQIAQFLVKLFFKYVQLNCFYVEEDWIHAKLLHCYAEHPEFSAGDISWVCSLFAILAIGTQMAHMESGKSDSAPEAPEDLTLCSEDEVGKLFFHSACKLVPDVITLASQESVQACLLLATYAMPLSTGGLSYTYLGLSMNMIILNGMHRKYTGAGCDAQTIETRNRLFWTAYTLERYISVMHGRPVSIARADISADLPTDFPGLRSPHISNLMAFIELNDGLFDSSEALQQFRRCPKALFPEYAGRLLQVRNRIKKWWDQLPAETQCHGLAYTRPSFRANAQLRLCYLLVSVYIGRPFLFSDEYRKPADSSRGPAGTGTRSGSGPNVSVLVDDCIQAAVQVIDLLQSLSDHVGLSRASYTEFSSCRASLLILLTESLRADRRRRVTATLDRGMALIRQMTGGNSNQSEVSLIEYLERAIEHICASRRENALALGLEADDDDGQGEDDAAGAARRDLANAYASFKTWAQMKKDGNGSAERLGGLSSPSPRAGSRPFVGDSLDTPHVSIDAAELLNNTWSFGDEDAEFDPFLFTLVSDPA